MDDIRAAVDDTASDTMEPIHVRAEWGELRECVYGWSKQFVFPKFLQDADVRPSGEFRQFWHDNQERDVADADPAYFSRWSRQIDNVVAFLEREGVRVHQPTRVSKANMRFPRGENHGCLTGWLRDPFVTIGSNVIELAPRSLFHRRQRFSVRHILARTMDRGAHYFAQPDSGADDTHADDEVGWGYLEGGDIFVLGTRILVGHSGNASNPEGARWLQHALGPDYQVEMVRIDARFAHLDCVLMTPRDGVAAMCTEALLDGVPEYLRDWDIIDIPFDTAKVYLGCNNLVMNDHFVVMPAEAPHDPLARELKKRSFEVHRMPYGEVYKAGGSFRCAHQPLIRR